MSTPGNDTAGSTGEGSLWGARFASGPSPELARLSRSIHFDWQLAGYDLAGSSAHAKALASAGYLSDDELERMLAAIVQLAEAVVDGSFEARDDEEDVHAALERGLDRDGEAVLLREGARLCGIPERGRTGADARRHRPARPERGRRLVRGP